MHPVYFRNIPCYIKQFYSYATLHLNNVKGSESFAIISARGNIIMNGAVVGTVNQLKDRNV